MNAENGPSSASVDYKVKLPYPSKSVLEFYDGKLKDLGWEPFAEPYYTHLYGDWKSAINKTLEGAPLVHHLYAKWARKDKRRMLFLSIKYYSRDLTGNEKYLAKGPTNDIQNIHLEIMTFATIPLK